MDRLGKIYGIVAVVLIIAAGILVFTGKRQAVDNRIRLVVLDPAHFHASLPQESRLHGVSDTVAVFAPEGDGLRQYLSTIDSFNSRQENPTSWKEDVYSAPDFLEKMASSHKGNVVVIAGDNSKKTEYILASVKAGYNVLADKPMAINAEDYGLLVEAYAIARRRGLIIYELMTERYDILNIVERELIYDKELFGELLKGTPDVPSVVMSSVHCFFKNVSGKPLVRPAWYYDVTRQGEGIADVTTHLIDLMQWQCFPWRGLENTDMGLLSASHYPTRLSLDEYTLSTGEGQFPGYLAPAVKDGLLEVMSNGRIRFNMAGVNAEVSVRWDFEAPDGGGDSFASLKKGSRAYVAIEQTADTGYKRQLYVIRPSNIDSNEVESALRQSARRLQARYPFISVQDAGQGKYLIDIPREHRSGHTEHFGKVASSFFSYIRGEKIPEWEERNVLSKYHLTTEAVRTAVLDEQDAETD